MKNLKRKYIKMLELEFDDLREDIEVLIEEERIKTETGKISNYVFMENFSTLKNEIASINGFIHEIEELDVSKIKDISEMLEEVKRIFIKNFKRYGFTKTSTDILMRKIEKINLYLMHENK